MLLTAEETAKELQVSVWQVYRLAKAHRIPCHHLGASVRFNLQEVLEATATKTRMIPERTPAAQQMALARLLTRARQRRIA